VIFFNQRKRGLDNAQRLQSEEVHFDNARFLDHTSFNLCYPKWRILQLPPVSIGKILWRNDDARGVDACISYRTFKNFSFVQDARGDILSRVKFFNFFTLSRSSAARPSFSSPSDFSPFLYGQRCVQQSLQVDTRTFRY
jgi:hypothetical protein